MPSTTVSQPVTRWPLATSASAAQAMSSTARTATLGLIPARAAP
jgi:hypothetical protein